jgi:AraC family transcriptional regulator of adaptative response / DNA-3-methyladenine glycosylase II
MATLARAVGISPAQLRRGFREYLGTSPQSYVRGKRLNAARLMIETTDLPIHMISRTHGFASAALFTRTMKQAFGLAPLDLRLPPNKLQSKSVSANINSCARCG